MSKFCLRFVLALPLVVLSSLFFSTPVYAERVIGSATLNGSSSVTVEPSASITASVTVTTSGGGPSNDWQSTSWNTGSGASCVDHANHTSSGTYTESFTITAPSSDGAYDVSFIAYQDNNCSWWGASNTFTLIDGIFVFTPTLTPTPSPTPTPTPTPTFGPTPTPTPSSQSSDSASTAIIYPAITLQQAQGLQFAGTASISQGIIDLAEYSLDDGVTWQRALPKDGKFDEILEDYAFSLQSTLAQGEYKILARARSLAQVYTQSSNYASITIDVTPPRVKLDEISPNPTKDQTPTISGTASSDYVEISSVQVSLDDGDNWLLAELVGNRFSLITETLEDGNYLVKARAFDAVGNVSVSETQVVIVDTIPPIIGGNVVALGPQLLMPDKLGAIRTVAGAQNLIIMSMKGGVTKAVLKVSDEAFELAPIEGTALWSGNIKFDGEGEKPAKITAVDGVGNKTERDLSPFLVEESGKVIDGEDGLPIEGAKVSLFLFETISETWVVWDGSSFGQKNPQETGDDGVYSYVVPSGRYYLEVKASDYRMMRSEIFDLDETSTLVATFSLSLYPRVNFHLPIFGEISFVIPFPIFAQTLSEDELWREEAVNVPSEFEFEEVGKLSDFSLLDSEGKTVDISDYKGKSLLLTFLSIWAPPSIEQVPILDQAKRELGEKQSMLVVFLQDSPGEVETFMKRGNYDFDVLIDKDGITAADYQVSTLPQHLFVNSDGIIDDRFAGVLDKEALLEKLDKVN